MITSTVVAATIDVTLDGSPAVSLAIAAAVALNTVDDDVRASVVAAAVTGTAITVKASSSTPVTGTAVAVGIAVSIGDEASIGLTGAGAEVRNENKGSTAATISSGVLTATSGALSVTAQSGAAPGTTTVTQSATVAAATAGISISGTGLSVAVTVAVALAQNTWSADTAVRVDTGSDLCAGARSAAGSCAGPAGAVTIGATSTESASAGVGAGTISISVGQSGGGLSIAVALATNSAIGSTTATVDASTVVGGSVAVTAEADATAYALTVAISVGIAGAEDASLSLDAEGAKSSNTVGGAVGVAISGGSVISAGAGDITVSATALSTLTADGTGGSIAITASASGFAVSVAIGIGLASNTLSTAVSAAVSASTLDAQGSVSVLASSDRRDTTRQRLTALAVAVAVAIAIVNPEEGIGVGASGAGTGVTNEATGSVLASIDTGSAVIARGAGTATAPAINVAATDTTTTSTLAVAVSAAGSIIAFAIGASIVTITLNTTVTAQASSATLSAPNGAVSVVATRTADAGNPAGAPAQNVVVAVSLGIGGAGAGARTTTTVGGSTTGSVTGSTVDAVGVLTVGATTSARSIATTDAGSGALLFAVTALFATATTTATTTAAVDASTVRTGGLTVSALRQSVPGQTDTTNASIVMVAISLIAAGAGANAVATDSGAVEARIGTGSDVTASGIGAVSVSATANSSTVASPNGGAAGAAFAGIVVPLAAATHSASTTAAVGADAGVRANSLTVTSTSASTISVPIFTLGLGLAGGAAGSSATAIESGIVEARIGAAVGDPAPTNPRAVAITGAVTIAAVVDQNLTVSVGGGGGGLGLGIGALIAAGTNSAVSRAYIGDGTRLTAGRLEIGVRNGAGTAAVRSVTVTTVVGAAALGAAGAGSSSTATITGRLDAFIGANAAVTVVGSATVSSVGAATATADARGGAGSLFLSVGVFLATATIAPADANTPSGTRAWVGSGTTLSTGSLRVEANGTDAANATILAVAVSLIASGAGGSVNALVDSDVQSFIGTPTGSSITSVTASGAVDVVATASQAATAGAKGGAGSFLAVAWLDATSGLSSTVSAFIGDGVSIGSAGSVLVRAETVNASSTSDVLVGGGGGITVDGATVTSTSAPTVTAFVGDGVAIGSGTPVGSDVSIVALSRAEANSTANIYAGGVIVVAPPKATATIDPTVDAHVGTPTVRTTTIVAAGSITLAARLIKTGTTPSDLLGTVDLTTDTVVFTYPQVGEGTQVMYSANGQPVLGGLHDGNVYTLLGGNGQIRLGSLFTASNVDPRTDTITFPVGHGFASGDCVWYDPRGGASIIGSGSSANSNGCGTGAPPTPGAQAFFVRVIDPITVRLTTTREAAVAPTDAPIAVTPLDGTHVQVPTGSGVGAGDQVVYRAPVSVPFASAYVDVDLTQRTVDNATIYVPTTNPDGSTAHNPAAENIYVGSAVYGQLNTGDALTYTLQAGAGGIGLDSGTTYYAIKTGDGYTIKLAASYCQAVGSAGDPSCAGVGVLWLPLTLVGPDSVLHQLDRSLGQLVDGSIYWVTSFDPDTNAITLATTLGGPALSLDSAHRPGQHSIGRNQVQLVAPTGTGQQALFADLTTACASNCGRLLAPSGQPLSTIAPPAGDGVSNAVANGGSGGVLDFPFPTATLNGSPSVSAAVAGTLTAGLDVTVLADSTFVASSSADTEGGGVIDVAVATSSVDLASGGSPTTVALAGSITAGRDLTATTTIDHTVSSSSQSTGGGFVAVKIAYSHAWLNDDATVTVADGTTLTAARALALTVSAKDTGVNASAAQGGAFGSGAAADDGNNPDRGMRLGSAGDVVQRGIDVGAGSALTGGTVSLLAQVLELNLSAFAGAFSAGFYAQAYANTNVDNYVDTAIRVRGPNTTISGVGGVDLRAVGGVDTPNAPTALTVLRSGAAIAQALIPPAKLSYEGSDLDNTSVTVDKGVTVTAGARGSSTTLAPSGADTALYVEAFNQGLARNFNANGTPGWCCLGDFTRQPPPNWQSGDISWDADVVILGGSGGAPVLVVGADGTVLAATNVLINGTAPKVGDKLTGPIVLSPIAPVGGANVVMQANNAIANGTSTAGDWPLFEWRTTVASVTIINLSDLPLTVGGIDVVGTPGATKPLVKLIPNTGLSSTFKEWAKLEFDVKISVGTTYVDIEQRSPTATDLVIGSPIINPLGLTRLVNLNGSITGAGLVTTNQLDVYAPNGSIGTALGPLRVDLVRFASVGSSTGPPVGTVVDPRLVVQAGGDVYLSLQGVDRANPTATSMTLYVDAISAGGQAVLTLRTAVAQPVAAGGGSIDVQVVEEQTQWAAPIPHSCHFRGGNSSDPTVYDPCAGAVPAPDPSTPTGAGTPIASTVTIGQRNAVLPRVEVPGVGGDHYAAAISPAGSFTLFAAAAAPPGSPGIVANGIGLFDVAGAGDHTRRTSR